MNETVNWLEGNCPYSPRFNDVYRSRTGGALQAQVVFLGGCQLPQRWTDAPDFCILETGFGLGLNFLATWSAWQDDTRRCDKLHYVAIEAYPVQAVDLLRSALALNPPNPKLIALATELANSWIRLRPGLQHIELANGAVCLTLAIGQVLPMLRQLDYMVDAVFLDGFNPAKNPEMWAQTTLNEVAARCKSGSVLATYSVAASVRKGLSSAGFSVWRRPGVPPKWHRLEGIFRG